MRRVYCSLSYRVGVDDHLSCHSSGAKIGFEQPISTCLRPDHSIFVKSLSSWLQTGTQLSTTAEIGSPLVSLSDATGKIRDCGAGSSSV
jgi:hypothetical protein